VWIATDPNHTARAVLPPPPSSAERRKLLRDALRLTFWRAIDSTSAWLVPEQVDTAACGL
jgi:hypothetical protein